jgi:hypothetical protein
MLHVESKITIYDCHLFKKISRIGYCIPILSNMEFNMIQLIGITVTFTKFVISYFGHGKYVHSE